ncbi:MAG: 23S rRNA (adenine(2503)-C(2))-methyltransferase RlmN, partial [Deltaproteobacteria bacterium]|nr:23S rRNA (adenine(2503)-C(2))-methyltransferase RlmN [Deltaproteobacteria bacterium]
EARRLVSVVQRTSRLPAHAPPPMRRGSFARVVERGEVPELRRRDEVRSALDPFVKLTFESPLGGTFETVRIPLERPGRMTVCVSSQVGCALRCAFCATGRLGLRRNLTPWEIVEQVRVVRSGLPAGSRVHGVVFQGMGEPLANLASVLQAIRVFTEPSALAIDARNVTVSTSGLPAGIRTLAAEAPRVRLALSIGSALPGDRRTLMPIDDAHPLAEVLAAARDHVHATGLAPLFAYTLLRGRNDGDEHARALAELVLGFAAGSGRRPRLSLIPYNSIGPGDPFERTGPEEEARFVAALEGAGVPSHRRYSGGSDVGAACGQLASR